MSSVFRAECVKYNQPSRIVTLGHYYPQAEVSAAKATVTADVVREKRPSYRTSDTQKMQEGIRWTRWINALNKERKWVLRRLFEQLDPILEEDIALAVVPPHHPYPVPSPVCLLARQLATGMRIDATGCLVRHTEIQRIVFGGPSTRALHRATIRVEHPDLIAGRRVLLLDDIAKSGASLIACRELLEEAGAKIVQAFALGRLIAKGNRP